MIFIITLVNLAHESGDIPEGRNPYRPRLFLSKRKVSILVLVTSLLLRVARVVDLHAWRQLSRYISA